MTNMIRPIALVDTNILYSAGMRDILLQLAVADLFEPKWSPDIRSELINTFRRNRPDIDPKRIERIWAEMNHYFSKALITGYEDSIDGLELPDPNDRHVLAAAIHAGCNIILTHDLKHFPVAVLKSFGIKPFHPDEFFMMFLRSNPNDFVKSLRAVRVRLKNPPYSVEEYLEKRMQDGLALTITELQKYVHLL